MDRFTASEARSSLPEILDRVEGGEEVAITRHGREVAVVVPPDALRRRRVEALLPEVKLVRESFERAARGERPPSGLSNERAEELVAEIRADRSGGR